MKPKQELKDKKREKVRDKITKIRSIDRKHPEDIHVLLLNSLKINECPTIPNIEQKNESAHGGNRNNETDTNTFYHQYN